MSVGYVREDRRVARGLSSRLPLLVCGLLAVALVAVPLVAAHRAAAAGQAATFAWGYNSNGELGDGTTTSTDTPVAVSVPVGVTFTALAGGDLHSLALTAGGSAYAWGTNSNGELGNGTTTSSDTPVAASMPAGVTFTAVAGGYDHSLALASDGTAYAWGANNSGELGNGTTTGSDIPMPVTMPMGVTFTAIAGGYSYSLGLASDGVVYAWGANKVGQLGDGTTSSHDVPAAVSMPAGVTFTAIAGGYDHSLALALDGTAYAWGANNNGQLGDGTTTSSDIPVAVSMPAGVTFTAIAGSHSMALATDGSAYAWGANTDGQLGDGTTTSSDIPVAVTMPAGVTFTAVAGGDDHSLALATDGSAYGWGANSDGELGIGTTTESHVPVVVTAPAGVSFTAIAAGDDHSLALASQGTATTTVQDSSPSIAYDAWFGVVDPAASGGMYRICASSGARATFRFSGTGVTWVTRQGPDQGIASVTIDGARQSNVDLYAVTTQGFSETYSGLASHLHTIVIRVTGTKDVASSAANVVVDAFLVGSTTIQDSSTRIIYDAWKGARSISASEGTYRLNGTAGGTVSLSFNGTSVTWITATGPAYGMASVSMDGLDEGTVDLYTPSIAWQASRSYGGLSAGVHSILVSVLGTRNASSTGTNVVVDAFVVHS